MSRLDIFVCDRCDKRVVNMPNAFGSGSVGDWIQATFELALDPRGIDTTGLKSMLLCPACNRAIHEQLPREIKE